MKQLKKLVLAGALGVLTLALAGCGGGDKKAENTKPDTSKPVIVGVNPGPHAIIMENVKKIAEKKGLKIEIKEFSDFVTPNAALAAGEIWANSYQHEPFLKATMKKEPKFKLAKAFNTALFPINIYSKKLKPGDKIPDGAKIGIPNDPTNGGRSLLLLAANNLIKVKDPKANIVVSPSDHIVTNENEFRRVVTQCLKFTGETDAIVTLGMKPTRPETGYGYIQADLSSSSMRNKEIFRVDSFREKPDLQTALQYIRNKSYFWNSGIFIWNVNTIVNAFRMYSPNINKIFEKLVPVLGTPQERSEIDKWFPECESISVDYAIMEKAEEIFVCPADFGWSDLGTWGSLYSQTKHDLYGNSVIGENVKIYDSHNCIIHTLGMDKVVIQGLDGYIIAQEDGRLLICKLSEEQRIKQFSE